MKTMDFTTANRISKRINRAMKDVLASSLNGRTIEVKVPEYYKNNTSEFVTKIENLEVEPDAIARVIIDERTGTIVMGENVRISTVAVAHGNLFVQIKEDPEAVQPPELSGGETAIVPRTRVITEEGEDHLIVVPKGIGISEVVNALNSIGVTPRDLISILQASKASGALHAELDLM